MNQAPFFNAQFFDDDGLPLAGGKLYSYLSGTTTPQATYTDQAGTSENTNPIILNAAGRCDLWLDPAVEYTFALYRDDDTLVKTWDDVRGVANAGDVVTSVNAEVGDVVLTADDIGFTTGTSTEWFSGTDVAAALDSIITQVDGLNADSVSLTAADIPIVDAGGLYTATNVETALAEVMTAAQSGLPSQTGNSGKFLTTNGTAASWANVALPAFTASIPGGDLAAGSVAYGNVTYGSRTVVASGGTAPYTYYWIAHPFTIIMSAPNTATTNFSGSGDGATITGWILAVVTDATGRVTTAAMTVTATHAASV